MASIYDSWKREDDDAAQIQQQAALVSYLNGTITADEVVHEWTKQLTDSENCSAELPWDLLIDAVEEFPQAHHKLVEVLDVVAQLPTTGEGNAGKLGLTIPELMFDLHEAFSGKSNVCCVCQLPRADVMYCRHSECITEQSFDNHG